MPKFSVLVVDDDEDDFIIVRDLFEEIAPGKHTIEWASSFSMGEALLARNSHNVCLMDYSLGADDGITLLTRAPSLGFTGPIILLSGMERGEIDIKAMEAGAVDYLVKGKINAFDLTRSIRYALVRNEVETERNERLRAEAENKAKSTFLAHLSHELRTPLSAILGYTELLLRQNTQPEINTHLKTVYKNGKHLAGLLNDVLDLSKIEAGKLDLSIETVNLSTLISDIYRMIAQSAEERRVELLVISDDDCPLKIKTDSMRLSQILINLLTNAIKFTNEGSIKLAITTQLKDEKRRLVFSVEDTGVGIPNEDLDRIFLPFQQSRLGNIGAGSGLGLAICAKLVKALGGELKVSSQEGIGTKFFFDLATDAEDFNRTGRIEYLADSHFHFELPQELQQHNVLVVDDNDEIRILIAHHLSELGLNVIIARNGQEAINLVNANDTRLPLDIIFMDINMPILDGMSACKMIRANGFQNPIIAVTAAYMKGDEETYIAAGFTSFIRKPIFRGNIISCLQRFLLPDQSCAQSGAIGDLPMGPKTEQLESDSPQRTHVLIIEDAEDVAASTRTLLSFMGFNATIALTGAQACTLCENNFFDFIILDLNLPDISSDDLLLKLELSSPKSKLIVVSGSSEPIPARFAPKIYSRLLKPIAISELAQLMS